MASEQVKRDVLVSIKPIYADKIMDGAKTVEFRRRFPRNLSPGTILLIYSSSPTRAIIGCATIQKVHQLSVEALWRRYGAAGCILRTDFFDYFDGLARGTAIVLDKVRRFRSTVPAARLKSQFGLIAPQSFMYLRREHCALLDDEPAQGPHRHQRLHRP
ncbi:MAG: hypothetical protein DCF16_17255 [Alphaproteobacteria bacterium]|nr:MAG: hypothetical protein DCF16_17255 [Alphaproteobacteria bacterium]